MMTNPTPDDITEAFKHGLWLRTAGPIAGESRMLADLACAHANALVELAAFKRMRELNEFGPWKYESLTQPGLYYWAAKNEIPGGTVETYGVVSQVDGFPETEAHDDWFGNLKDADEIARQLAAGTYIP